MSSKKAVLYARMSDRKKKETRLDDQILDCREYAAKLNTKYAAKIENRREIVRRMGLQVELGGDNKKRYADVVIISPEILTLKSKLRIAGCLLVKTDLPPTIYRKRIILPRRARRKAGSAS